MQSIIRIKDQLTLHPAYQVYDAASRMDDTLSTGQSTVGTDNEGQGYYDEDQFQDPGNMRRAASRRSTSSSDQEQGDSLAYLSKFSVPRSAELTRGLEAIKDECFVPSKASFSSVTGTIQSCLTGWTDVAKKFVHGSLQYDDQEIFQLRDGGEIAIDYLGDSFREGRYWKQFKNPILVIIPGFTNDGSTPQIESLAELAHNTYGYDVAVINWRGHRDLKLSTPKIVSFSDSSNVEEPLNHIYKKYCKEQGRKLFALGLSLGAQHLAKVLGEQSDNCKITAAFVVQCAMRLPLCMDKLEHSCNGLLNYKLGFDLQNMIQENPQVFQEYFQNKFGIDMEKQFPEITPHYLNFDKTFGAKMNGFESTSEYYNLSQPVNVMGDINVPTFFLNALDDPLVHESSIDYEVFNCNENICLGTTKHGGHLGYNESVFQLNEKFYQKLALKFFDQFK